MKRIIVSGYFNPLHSGHIDYLREAKKLGDYLIVIVNSDEQVRLKGSVPFMDEKERLKIVKAIKYVDWAIISDDMDKSVCFELSIIKDIYSNDELIFANGGDRSKKNVPELALCKKIGIKMVFNVGGKKVKSSSEIIKNAKKHKRV